MAELKPCVLLSIQPKWCELIASGEKTVEIRKTRPKLETPFKCYIYCTINGTTSKERDRNIFTDLSGKVIGEFVCDKIIAAGYGSYSILSKLRTWIHEWDLLAYADGKTVYGWHISDFVLYDKPKELTDFKFCNSVKGRWDKNGNREMIVRKPPQSWCYVEKESD